MTTEHTVIDITYSDNDQDEIINIRLPRKDYETMRQLIAERQTMGHVKAIVTSSWVWVVAGGLLAVFALWDKIKIGVFS